MIIDVVFVLKSRYEHYDFDRYKHYNRSSIDFWIMVVIIGMAVIDNALKEKEQAIFMVRWVGWR